MLSRHFTSRLLSSVNIAVVGSGPGAFYAVKGLLDKQADVRVDFFEKVPVPYGLLRYGVAPDHPEVKQAWKTGQQVLENKQVRWVGNVEVGKDVTVEELQARYNAVIFAYGASQDRKLGIPGEDAPGVHSARGFVEWYNGMPGRENTDFQLDKVEQAVVLGVGNVAMDVVRILNAPLSLLSPTDIKDYAIRALKNSTLKTTTMAARRGPLQAAFTIKELREMINLGKPEDATKGEPNTYLDLVWNPAEMDPAKPFIEDAVKKDRSKKRLTELMYQSADTPIQNNPRCLNIRFLLSPKQVLQDSSGRVTGMEFTRNAINDKGEIVPTNETETVPCQMIIRAIGYSSIRLPNAPFDAKRNLIPNKDGRVVDTDGNTVKGMYTSGWVGTGPIGVIVSTMNRALLTSSSILKDIENGVYQNDTPTNRMEGVLPLLKERGTEFFTWSDWNRIKQVEEEIGEKSGKVAEKFVALEDFLQFRGGNETELL